MVTEIRYRLPTDPVHELERMSTFDHGDVKLEPAEINRHVGEALDSLARTIGPALWLRIEVRL